MTLAEGLAAESRGEGSVRVFEGRLYWSTEPPRIQATAAISGPTEKEAVERMAELEALESRRAALWDELRDITKAKAAIVGTT